MSRLTKTIPINIRGDVIDAANLNRLDAAARSRGGPAVRRSAIIRSAIAFAAANIDAFADRHL